MSRWQRLVPCPGRTSDILVQSDVTEPQHPVPDGEKGTKKSPPQLCDKEDVPKKEHISAIW